MDGTPSRLNHKYKKMKIAYCQTSPKFGRVQRNLDAILKQLSEARADLVVLPELPFTGYNFSDREETLSLAEEPGNSPIVEALVQQCKKRDFTLVTGFAERHKDKCYDSALLLDADGIQGLYRKIHLFNREKECFDPGDMPPEVYEVSGVKIGIMVCFDWAFPEMARTLALKGAQILCHPCNLVLGHCQRAMVVRCQENRVFAVTANRIGEDARPHGTVGFTGRSQIVQPDGKIRFRAPSKRGCLHIAEIDPEQALDKHMTQRNDVHADRRPDMYELGA